MTHFITVIPRRYKLVKEPRKAVKKASTLVVSLPAGLSFGLAIAGKGPADAVPHERGERPAWIQLNGDQMSVLAYIVLTVAIFALFGLAQKLVERL